MATMLARVLSSVMTRAGPGPGGAAARAPRRCARAADERQGQLAGFTVDGVMVTLVSPVATPVAPTPTS